MKNKGKLIISAIIIMCSGFFYFEAGKFRQLKAIEKIGPEFWPRIVLICLFVLALFVFITDLVKRKNETDTDVVVYNDVAKKRLLLGGFLIFSYIILMAFAGFAVLTPLFMAFFMVTLGETRKWFIALSSVVFTAVVIIIFSGFFYLAIPRGVGIFRSFSLIFY